MTAIQVAALLGVVFILQTVFLWFVFGKQKRGVDASSGMLLLQKQVQELERTLDKRVTESSRQMQEDAHRRHTEASKLIKEITQEITSVKEIGRQTGKFAEQLQNLQDILKNPKQRGVLGEYFLETVLKNVLPPGMYEMQYRFRNAEIVDAVIFINEKIIPVDSKFSLENYNRFISAPDADRNSLEKAFVNDLKMRIQETAKYIRPEEGTMDFAFMFIPSEGIYYDLLTNRVGAGEDENLIQRAAGKNKVIIVSPTSLLAYLQTVMQGLRALHIEKKAEEIQKRVAELGKHIGSYEEFYKKLGNALGLAVSHYNSAYKELLKIDTDVYRIAETKIGIDLNLLEKPSSTAE